MIRIAIVDDHALFRDSIARLLAAEADIQVVGVCGDRKTTVDLLTVNTVDVLLLDYDLGAELGSDLIATLHSDPFPPKVLMVSGGMSPAACRRSLQAGAAGLVLKHSSWQMLVHAIREVHRGGQWWDKEALEQKAVPEISFTPRQQRILDYVLDGFSNKEIAVMLDSSEAAVKASLQELFRKTGVRTRSQLVRIMLEANLHIKQP